MQSLAPSGHQQQLRYVGIGMLQTFVHSRTHRNVVVSCVVEDTVNTLTSGEAVFHKVHLQRAAMQDFANSTAVHFTGTMKHQTCAATTLDN